jgi:hypothetical protein
MHDLSDWHEVKTGSPADGGCLSRELANLSDGAHVQAQSWREAGCWRGGAGKALWGAENHARIWPQSVPGSETDAWFISASYETACVLDKRDHKEHTIASDLRYAVGHHKYWWHCIDGSQGSFGTDGYNRGAAELVAAIEQAGEAIGIDGQPRWDVTVRTNPRPSGRGEGHDGSGPAFSGTVYVVTVDYPNQAA